MLTRRGFFGAVAALAVGARVAPASVGMPSLRVYPRCRDLIRSLPPVVFDEAAMLDTSRITIFDAARFEWRDGWGVVKRDARAER